MFDIVGLDHPCVDCLINLPYMPACNESMRVLANSWQGGGKVATALAAVGRLGAKGAIIGACGDDPWGRFCKADLEYHGIDTSHLRLKPDGKTSLNFVVSDKSSQGRSILYCGGSSDFEITKEELEMVRSARMLHLSWFNPNTVKAAKAAREAGTLVTYDGDGFREEIVELLPLVDVFVGSEFFYKAYFGTDAFDLGEIEKNCRAIRERFGFQIAGFTFGGKGSAAVDSTGFYYAPAPSVEVVDTVGAGDTYHGAFDYALLQGWELPKVLEFAGAVASFKCQYIGGRAGIPTLAMAEAFIASGEKPEGDIPQRLERYRKGILE